MSASTKLQTIEQFEEEVRKRFAPRFADDIINQCKDLNGYDFEIKVNQWNQEGIAYKYKDAGTGEEWHMMIPINRN